MARRRLDRMARRIGQRVQAAARPPGGRCHSDPAHVAQVLAVLAEICALADVLARAILAARRGKRVLILDEPTSQYDVRGETNFYNTVMAELAGVTVVLITHRLSTVRRADRIALLQDGQISEVGTHDELLDHGGAYAAMFRAQADRFREIA